MKFLVKLKKNLQEKLEQHLKQIMYPFYCQPITLIIILLFKPNVWSYVHNFSIFQGNHANESVLRFTTSMRAVWIAATLFTR